MQEFYCVVRYERRNEFTIEGQCLMWGSRVIIPKSLRDTILEELHREHLGIVKTKAIACSYFWLPGFDKCLEALAKSCQSCQEAKQSHSNLLSIHGYGHDSHGNASTSTMWSFYFMGENFFLVIDTHSKWGETHIMPSTTSAMTIECLCGLFAAYITASSCFRQWFTIFFIRIRSISQIQWCEA